MKKILLSLVVASSVIVAEGAFSIGHKNFTFSISQDNDYTVIGGSLNYYVVDGLSTGVSFSTWLGDKPSINQVTVPLTYYVPLESSFRPYVGAFVSRTFMGNDGAIKYEDYTSYGGRVGIAMQISGNSYMSFGWVQETYDNGQESGSRGYPEFGGGISF